MKHPKSFLSTGLPLVFLPLLGLLVYGTNYKSSSYYHLYETRIQEFVSSQKQALDYLSIEQVSDPGSRLRCKEIIHQNRLLLKSVDFWLRYFHPQLYRKINGPLMVEWETEVFEKFEVPYKRIGAGLGLAESYLEEADFRKDSFLQLINLSIESSQLYLQDSVTIQFNNPDHFYFANRMFLLNLAAIYTTGFECPNPNAIIPELRFMLNAMPEIYAHYNQSYPTHRLPDSYRNLFSEMLEFVRTQSSSSNLFDHYRFIKKFVNPLFKINQDQIVNLKLRSKSFNDYSLNNQVKSIFDKNLYEGQDYKGIFRGIKNDSILNEIKALGKLLFYDPIMSGNLKRACASCHKPTQFFTDTLNQTALKFDQKSRLPRSTPSLTNVVHNHLIMLDGKHIDLKSQLKDVVHNSEELNANEQTILKNVLSCKEYNSRFQSLKRYGGTNSITFEHLSAAIILYYSDFSFFDSDFDLAMNAKQELVTESQEGFNLFMGKAQCGTCHFVPQFNGVKPPYIGSEFEVIGVPLDTSFRAISPDPGRFKINPAFETNHAFRTGSIRNAAHTMPYMHQGVFRTMDEVLEFYNAGGGLGKGLKIDNQSLSADKLELTALEKQKINSFIQTLTEKIPIQVPPSSLPLSSKKELNNRKVGGEY